MFLTLVGLLVILQCAVGSQKVFSVNDDVFAYPQYEIDFSSPYVLEDEAAARISASRSRVDVEPRVAEDDEASMDEYDYEQLVLHGRRYLCSIPHVKEAANVTEVKPSKEEQSKELARAADRGWQLLHDMEGKQCLYYSTGWWSYSFCYNSHVKQFHSLPPSPSGGRSWPPQEDNSTPSYILGKYEPKQAKPDPGTVGNKPTGTELQTRADGNYLVQRLGGGTRCDLTGKDRKVEIEFHCHPQTTDRIGWIKETTTCAYLMVVYTPRLCNDVAFQPPRDSQAHTISCQEILSVSDAAHLQEPAMEAISIEQAEEKPIVIGKIELGAMKYIGKDGKKIERGRIVMTADERAEIVVMRKNGLIETLSRAKLKELKLDQKDIEEFQKELQKIAGARDWKIERLADGNGQIQLRGIIITDSNGGEEHYEAAKDEPEDAAAKKGRKDEL